MPSYQKTSLLSHHDLALTARGLVTEAPPYIGAIGAVTPTSGKVYARLVGLRAGDVVTNCCIAIQTAGAGTVPTSIKMGLYSLAGVSLAISAEQKSNAIWTTAASIAQCPLSAPYTVPTSGGYYVVFLSVGSWGTTQMQVSRPQSGSPGGIGGIRPWCSFGTGQTDLTAVGLTAPAQAAEGDGYWMGAS